LIQLPFWKPVSLGPGAVKKIYPPDPRVVEFSIPQHCHIPDRRQKTEDRWLMAEGGRREAEEDRRQRANGGALRTGCGGSVPSG
jgi:hypothetical protein